MLLVFSSRRFSLRLILTFCVLLVRGRRPEGRLFIAIPIFNETELLDTWKKWVLPNSVAVERGYADVRFFTDNAEYDLVFNNSIDIVYINTGSNHTKESRTHAPWYWRDYMIQIFQTALKVSPSFTYFLRAELDSVLCIDTIFRSLPSNDEKWTLGLRRKCGYDDTFLLASRAILQALIDHWIDGGLRNFALIEAGGNINNPEKNPGWPMLGPVLPRLIYFLVHNKTYYTTNITILATNSTHLVSSEWPHPSLEESSAPWFGAVAHSPHPSHWDGVTHNWNQGMNPRSKTFLGTHIPGVKDQLCFGHFYLHKVKSISGIKKAWEIIMYARLAEKKSNIGYGPPLPTEFEKIDNNGTRHFYPDIWPDFWQHAKEKEMICSPKYSSFSSSQKQKQKQQQQQRRQLLLLSSIFGRYTSGKCSSVSPFASHCALHREFYPDNYYTIRRRSINSVERLLPFCLGVCGFLIVV